MPYEYYVVRTTQDRANNIKDLIQMLNEGWAIVMATPATSGTGTGWIEYVLRRERQSKEG